MWGYTPKKKKDMNNTDKKLFSFGFKRLKYSLRHPRKKYGPERTKDVDLCPMNPQMLYAMKLHEYVDEMRDFIKKAELAVEYNLMLPLDSQDTTLPDPPSEVKTVKANKPINYIEKHYNEFTSGIGDVAPYVSDLCRKHMEHQTIATILSQIGYHDTTESILYIVTDIFEEFLETICDELRVLKDMELTGRPNQFPDDIEYILRKFNMGGIEGIINYYENRVNNYEYNLYGEAQEVYVHYENLLTPSNVQTDSESERHNDLDNADVPEVHLTTMDGEEGYLQPFLESGFQMLNSLEEGHYPS